MSSPCVIISIHDVAPATLEKSRAMVHELCAAGASNLSLLVVPDYHHLGSVSRHAESVAWIKERESAGDEIVLHGLYHLRPKKTQTTLIDNLITSHYTAGEGEFYDPSAEEAVQWITQGEEILAEAGFSPCGFIAPAWLCNQATQDVLKARGYTYTTLLNGIIHFSGPTPFTKTQSCVWSVRAGWRRICSVLWNRTLFRQLQNNPVLRIGLHPPDFDHPLIKNQILDLIRRSVTSRKCMTYKKFISNGPNIS